MADASVTRSLAGARSSGESVRSFRLEVVEGECTGLRWESAGDRCLIGSHPSNQLVIDDATVSRFHCEIQVGADGARLRDAGSLNGTVVDGVRVIEGFLRTGSLVRVGASVVRFEYGEQVHALPLSEREVFGALVGRSAAMRATFALLERAAATDATVLLEGETGTGKSAAACALHDSGARAAHPFVVVDCASIPANLLESELFGHERGAFTGAVDRRVGAFEEADGGTVFLDEIGELPPELQPKLLRVIESREIRPIGGNQWRPVDVRVVCATNRELRAAVNTGAFRSDLYYRLAVVEIPLPPLRRRPEDIPAIARRLLEGLGVSGAELDRILTPEHQARLQRSAWPGNVRELRNYVERCVVFGGQAPLGEVASTAQMPVVDTAVPFADARKQLIDGFERAYLEQLMREHRGKVSAAARASGIDRVHMYRLLRRHGLRD